MEKCQIIKHNSTEPSCLNVIPDKVKFQEEVWLGWLITFQEVPAPYEIQPQIPVCPVSSSVRIQAIEMAFPYLGKPPFLLALWLWQVKEIVYLRMIISKKSKFTLFSVNLSHILKVFKQSRKLNGSCFQGAFSNTEEPIGFAIVPRFHIACVFLTPA